MLGSVRRPSVLSRRNVAKEYAVLHGLCWQTVQCLRCSHRKCAVAESCPTSWRHQQRRTVDRTKTTTSDDLWCQLQAVCQIRWCCEQCVFILCSTSQSWSWSWHYWSWLQVQDCFHGTKQLLIVVKYSLISKSNSVARCLRYYWPA